MKLKKSGCRNGRVTIEVELCSVTVFVTASQAVTVTVLFRLWSQVVSLLILSQRCLLQLEEWASRMKGALYNDWSGRSL